MAPPQATRHNLQSQPLITLLRLICESYPPNTCLRELLQNADDAGAAEIEYILDTNTYIGEPLLHEALAEYQGPALLAMQSSARKNKKRGTTCITISTASTSGRLSVAIFRVLTMLT